MTQNNKKLEVEKLNAEIERLKKELKKRKNTGLFGKKNPKKWLRCAKRNYRF
ncbi:hypothetical protein HY750_00455 [Candidatus Kuenenbacteria bacterium]|nr:hypothetical protein [Candidatus Kuenenbacteria bacterium]